MICEVETRMERAIDTNFTAQFLWANEWTKCFVWKLRWNSASTATLIEQHWTGLSKTARINIFFGYRCLRSLAPHRCSIFILLSHRNYVFSVLIIVRNCIISNNSRTSRHILLLLSFHSFTLCPALSRYDRLHVSHFLFNVVCNMLYPVYSNLNFRSPQRKHTTRTRTHTHTVIA